MLYLLLFACAHFFRRHDTAVFNGIAQRAPIDGNKSLIHFEIHTTLSGNDSDERSLRSARPPNAPFTLGCAEIFDSLYKIQSLDLISVAMFN